MKRSYGQTSGPPAAPALPQQQIPQQQPQYAYSPVGAATTSMPPLPPGPPPPPPAAGTAPNPYAAYGYGYQQPQAAASVPTQAPTTAAHPQYPGYGYGTPTTARTQNATASPYASYSGGAYAQQQAAVTAATPAPQPTGPPPPSAYSPYSQPATASPTPATVPAQNPYAAYQQSYAASASTPGMPQYSYPQPPAPNPYGVMPPQQQVPPPPPPPQQPYGQPGGVPGYHPPGGMSAGGGPSPQGAPPFKRTRYDQGGPPPPPPPMGMGMGGGPPPALPPLNSGGGGYGGDRGGPSGRGGRGGGNFGSGPSRPPPPPGPGPGPRSGGGYGNDSYGGGPSYGGGGSSRGGGGGPSYRGGRGDNYGPRSSGYDSRPGPSGPRGGSGMGPGSGAPYPRGGPGLGPPSNAPFGPSGSRGHDRPSRGGGRPAYNDSRSRPVSGLPSSSGRSYGSGSSGGGSGRIDAPKGPKSSLRGRDVNAREPRRERKWGSKDGSSATGGKGEAGTSKDEAKRTLTDFRISGLAIPELDWSWAADLAKAVVAQAEGEAKKTEGKLEETKDEKKDEAVKVEDGDAAQGSIPAPSLPDENGAASEEKVDMSLDDIHPADITAAISSDKVETEVKPKTEAEGEGEGQTPAAGKEAEVKVDGGSPEVEKTRKDGKHGRDDEEESLVITDVTVKKVKADTGEVVTLESVAGLDVSPASKPDKGRDSTPTPQSLPTGPKSSTVPVGESPSSVRAAPTNRENSRLRIYFASPVASVSTYSNTAQLLGDSKAQSIKEGTEPPGSVAGSVVGAEDQSAPPSVAGDVPAAVSAERVPAVASVPEVDEEDVDGVALQPDGPTLIEDPKVDSGEPTAPGEEDSDDDDLIQSSLRDDQPASQTETEEGGEGSAPVLPGENAAYPPDPYPDVPDHEENGEQEGGAATHELSVAPELLPPEPSADRISISYARNTRRMVLDADVVDKVKIIRGEGRIELTVAILPATIGAGREASVDEFRICRGVLVEALDPENDDYIVMDRASLELAWREQTEETSSFLDPLLPPLHHLFNEGQAPSPVDLLQGEGISVTASFNRSHITIVASLDRQNPLTEARWVKTGEVEPWIASLHNPEKKEVASEWKGKIVVADPDPPPTIQHALDTWATSSNAGTADERLQFVKGHMSDIDNVFEILLRLTRGDRAGPSHHTAATQTSTVGALAASLSAPYAEHQTQVSLAVLAMFRLSVETAAKAGIPKLEVEKQVGEIVRGIPYHLIFKSLDGMFREQKVKRALG